MIRECLSEHLLADCVQNSISNTKRTKYVHMACVYEQAVLVRVFGLKLAVLAEHSSPRAQTLAKNQEEGPGHTSRCAESAVLI